PTVRYRTARELADDLERYLADEPVSVLPEGIVSVAARILRRNRGAATAAAVALVAIALLATVSSVALNEQRKQVAALAEKERAAGLAAEKQLRIATAARFAHQSKDARKEHAVRSLLLAMEGVHSTLDYGEPVIAEATNELLAALDTLRSLPLLG